MRRLVLALALALAACGSGGDKAAPPPGQSPSASADAGSLCNGLPPFVSLLRAEVVSICTKAETQPGHVSGSVIYVTRAAPDDVIAFYKAKAEQAGIPIDVIEPSADGIMLLARDDGFQDKRGRSLMAHAAARRSGGSDVTVNWGYNK